MFNSGKRKEKRVTTVTTLIAHGTQIRGDLHFQGGLYLDGTIKGSVYAEGDDAVFTLSDKGCVLGEIHAPHVIVNGEVKGDIFASEHVELADKARVEGNIHYTLLETAAGAQVSGKMIYQEKASLQLSKPVERLALA